FLDEWTEKHDAMVEARTKELKARGLVTRTEDEGEFKLEGRLATLAGKPDVVGLDDAGQAEVYDQKSGKRRKSDKEQVRIYMFALPLTWLGDRPIRGYVEYKDGLAPVEPLTDADRRRIADAVAKVAGEEAPERVPSAAECRYCKIANCPDRVTESKGSTDAF
ncbi:MAG TPA: PD-(D/E)XK nuclease family protein, partial [Thermoanaerobaculia bacterium]|nr:PD-(D/E)XK nuclease family protein [Thermoanaerobaculia bacterium]